MRAVAYLRVSSVSQIDGHSLDAQDRLFHELCKKRGWEPVRTYREEEGRPMLKLSPGGLSSVNSLRMRRKVVLMR